MKRITLGIVVLSICFIMAGCSSVGISDIGRISNPPFNNEIISTKNFELSANHRIDSLTRDGIALVVDEGKPLDEKRCALVDLKNESINVELKYYSLQHVGNEQMDYFLVTDNEGNGNYIDAEGNYLLDEDFDVSDYESRYSHDLLRIKDDLYQLRDKKFVKIGNFTKNALSDFSLIYVTDSYIHSCDINENVISVVRISDGKIVYTKPAFSNSLITRIVRVLGNDRLFFQERIQLPADATEYDFYTVSAKYKLKQSIYDLNSQKETSITLNRVVNAIQPLRYSVNDEKLKNYSYLLSNPIENKLIITDTSYNYDVVNENLDIVLEKVSAISYLDDNKSITYNSTLKRFQIVDNNRNLINELGVGESVYDYSKSIIATSKSAKYYLYDSDGNRYFEDLVIKSVILVFDKHAVLYVEDSEDITKTIYVRVSIADGSIVELEGNVNGIGHFLVEKETLDAKTSVKITDVVGNSLLEVNDALGGTYYYHSNQTKEHEVSVCYAYDNTLQKLKGVLIYHK